MKIAELNLRPFSLPLTHGKNRQGFLIELTDAKGSIFFGEASPLPTFSHETLEQVERCFFSAKIALQNEEWRKETLSSQLEQYKLLPSLKFGIESALLQSLDPLQPAVLQASALLMGTPDEILSQADAREADGYRSAKIKIGHLNKEDAKRLLHDLKNRFKLRVDVNRTWDRKESLNFFSSFEEDAFDYVEEPFKNPHELKYFTHPLAIDESYPSALTLQDLENLPQLKALIYKPTIQGGYFNALSLNDWALNRGIQFILSSSFESNIGLYCVTLVALRLSNKFPIGIGTVHFLDQNYKEAFDGQGKTKR